MEYKFILPLLAFGLSAAAQAQHPLTFSPLAKSATSRILQRDAAVRTPMGTTPDAIRLSHASKASQSVARVRKVGEVESPYGEVVELLYEDFSKMTTGSIEAPDTKTKLNLDSYEYPWWSMNPDYTAEPNWGSNNAYSAGGCVCLNAKKDEGGNINTPLIDGSGYGRILTIQFKARTLEGTTSGLYVESAETYNMSPTWDFPGSAYLPEVTSEWQTYEFTIHGAGSSTLFNIVQLDGASSVYIDDIRVYQVDQYVSTPTTLPYSNYTGKSFDANWEAVEGAESYLLNVYSYDEGGNVVDLLTDQPVSGTTYTVDGIESGRTYYYTVRSVKGSHESIESLPVEVYDLEAPVLNAVEEMKDGTYTATWSEVPTAERYNYWAYSVRTAEADGEFVVTEENFDGLTRPDTGETTDLTVGSEYPGCFGESYLAEFTQAGWRGLNYFPYADCIMIDVWQYLNKQGDAGLVSPELDLSKDGGKVNLSVKIYGEIANMWTADGQAIPTQTEAAIALFNYDEAKGDYVQAELIYPEGVAEEWKTFNVTLTKGTSRSVIGIYGVHSVGSIYLDDLKITQNYKKGDTLMEPFFVQRWNDGTSVDVTIPRRIDQQPIYHRVSAVKTNPATQEKKESRFSALEKVTDHAVTSIVSLETKGREAVVTSDAQNLYIVNPQGARVDVYAIDGTKVFTDKSGSHDLAIPADGHGAYIVKVGSTTVKIVK